jgi:hypothetical protein
MAFIRAYCTSALLGSEGAMFIFNKSYKYLVELMGKYGLSAS